MSGPYLIGMNKQHRPRGDGPVAWEAGLLKLRAFEIVLVLFYMEDLRRGIVESIKTHDSIFGTAKLAAAKRGQTMEVARAVLVAEGIVTQAESDELLRLLDYRNLIGHHVHELTADIGAFSHLAARDPRALTPLPPYDYTAAERAKLLRKKVLSGLAGKLGCVVNMDSLRFEAAERTYAEEIKRLRRRVERQIDKFNEEVEQTNAIIRGLPTTLLARTGPNDPPHQRRDGSLTESGGQHAFSLFDAGATPLAVSVVMELSLRSAKLWFSKWKSSK